MKKIMFNDKYGLTDAVLEGRKTMTRRTVSKSLFEEWYEVSSEYSTEWDMCGYFKERAPYKIGEVVAIAQSYKDCGHNPMQIEETNISKPTVFPEIGNGEYLGRVKIPLKYHQGWKNKMYTKPNLMPHHIRITDIKVERLQNISDEDCLHEGTCHHAYEQEDHDGITYWKGGYLFKGSSLIYDTPREAFIALIDKVSGKGTWKRNPWVLVYKFELVKN